MSFGMLGAGNFTGIKAVSGMPGCGPVRLRHCLWEAGIVGSNPTNRIKPTNLRRVK